ncbi:MFS transporter [Paenibacillus hemerocallicola]|uniref:MFS transporter n=1 Tax=Paenibacillus hemerocallicola TaxID=1172614 RepID=A0A5C4T8H6_9BACL|nr:MFS transporter [Paenibacillus hemerocallicola]TNJ64629.1 MFS transporter [Paenibacillus hemerocallicola]
MKPNEPMYKFGMRMGPEVWRNAKIDFGSAGLVSLFNVVLNQFFIVFALQQGASNLQVGLLSAAAPIGLLFSPLWTSWIEKTNNPKPFVVFPSLFGRLLLFLPAFIPNPGGYVATAIVFQMLMAIQAPAYAMLISRIYPPDLRGRLMGYVRVPMGLLMIPLAYIIGNWTDMSGPSGPLIAAAVAGVVSILLFSNVRLPKTDAPPAISRPQFSFRDQWNLVKGNRTLAIFLTATMLSGFGNMLAGPLYQMIQVDVLQLRNVEIGYARVAYFTGLLLTYLIGGRMIDRFDIKHTLLCGIGAYAIVPMLYGLWGSYSGVIIGNFVQGIGEAIWDIGILAFIFRLSPGREAAMFGLHLMLFGIRGTLGPILSSLLADSVPLAMLLIAASLCAWSGTALFWLGNRKRSEPAASISSGG